MTVPSGPSYVLGHSSRELDRLQDQGRTYARMTKAFLIEMGLAPGMRVLDVGCGVGDVSLLAGEIVGPAGFVLGIDRASDPLTVARHRAEALGSDQVRFESVPLDSLDPAAPFDIVVGRFVLMHQPDPAGLVRDAARFVRPEGALGFLESDMLASVRGETSRPRCPTYDRILQLQCDVIGAAGAHLDMGLQLPAVFVEAGLPPPVVQLQAAVETESAALAWMVEALRSMRPIAERKELPGFSLDELDALEQAFYKECPPGRATLIPPQVVSAWTTP